MRLIRTAHTGSVLPIEGPAMVTEQSPGSSSSPARRHRGPATLGRWGQHGRAGAVRSYRALLASWPVRGYNQAGAGHLTAILA